MPGLVASRSSLTLTELCANLVRDMLKGLSLTNKQLKKTDRILVTALVLVTNNGDFSVVRMFFSPMYNFVI